MTSQRKDNLVLGTSETNSLMTRYERAWQTLLLYERNLQKKYDASSKKIAGNLKVERNPPDVSILYDWADPKDIEDLKQPLEFTYRWRSEKLREMEIGSNLTSLAGFHKYLAFVIKYDISIDRSFILMPPKDANDEARPVKTTVFFYPFLRSLYHKAEAKLDSGLYQILRADAECMLYERTNEPKDTEPKKLNQFRKKLEKLLAGSRAAGDEDLHVEDQEEEELIKDLETGIDIE